MQRGQTRSISSIQSSRLGLFIPILLCSSSYVIDTHFYLFEQKGECQDSLFWFGFAGAGGFIDGGREDVVSLEASIARAQGKQNKQATLPGESTRRVKKLVLLMHVRKKEQETKLQQTHSLHFLAGVGEQSRSEAVLSREGWTQIKATQWKKTEAPCCCLLVGVLIFVQRMLASPMKFRFNHVHPLTTRKFQFPLSLDP